MIMPTQTESQPICHCVLFCLLICASTLPLPAANANERTPNIILLIGDDHGWPYYGMMGSQDVQTPHLDQLARTGTKFTFGHTTCTVCRPTLLSVLTGLYPLQYYQRMDALPDHAVEFRSGTQELTDEDRRWGFFSNALQRKRWAFAFDHFTTLPRQLATLDYASFEGGKYWEGNFQRAGFTRGMSATWGAEVISKHGLLLGLAGGDGLALGRDTMQPLFDFIDEARKQPFFVWYAPMLPHTPHDPPERHLAKYRDRGFSESAQKYYANCTWFDEGVGQLVEFLTQRGLRENTLLVYFSDNGWEQAPQDAGDSAPDFAFYGGPRGKNSMHDFGFRTPFVFNWPGHVPGGQQRDDLVSVIDIFPTVLDYAGIAPASDLPGKSLRPTVERGQPLGRERFIGSMHQCREPNGWKQFEATGFYLRDRRWHYFVCDQRGVEQLFDMSHDPQATRDVAQQHPQLTADFRRRIAAWRREIQPPLTSE
jgi:uncharacterized sulfatase